MEAASKLTCGSACCVDLIDVASGSYPPEAIFKFREFQRLRVYNCRDFAIFNLNALGRIGESESLANDEDELGPFTTSSLCHRTFAS